MEIKIKLYIKSERDAMKNEDMENLPFIAEKNK